MPRFASVPRPQKQSCRANREPDRKQSGETEIQSDRSISKLGGTISVCKRYDAERSQQRLDETVANLWDRDGEEGMISGSGRFRANERRDDSRERERERGRSRNERREAQRRNRSIASRTRRTREDGEDILPHMVLC